jgi:hypothetical protein
MIEARYRNPKHKRSLGQQVWADAHCLVQRMRPGMIYGHFRATVGVGWETRFYVRECSRYLTQLHAEYLSSGGNGSAPPVELRAGLYCHGGVFLVPVMARIGTHLYETWLDYYRSGACLCFSDLMHQDTISISAYDADLLRVYSAPNTLRPLFECAMREISASWHWNTSRFDLMHQEVTSHYPTIEALWASLQAPTQPAVIIQAGR